MKLYNTLTRKKQEFKPEGVVKIYTCGPTVYDYAHIGNFRAYMCADVLKRYLLYKGFKVKHVMNLTDVDDKTITGSQKEHVSLNKYTEKYVKAFFEDLQTLRISKADVFPRATEHINEMVALVKTLLQTGYAYKGEDNSIYYNISKFKDYGKLSRIKKDELKVGARVSQDEYEKENAADFALWKAYTPEDGDVYWETEIGKGRPGWHIECSAMSMKYLGDTFDIHTGGIDLVFPHHENEIAQSEAATGKRFVRFWVHNEWLKVEGRKMSKSFGNFYTLRDVVQKGYSPKAIRYLLLSSHYKNQLNFTFEGLDAANSPVQRLQEFVIKLQNVKNQDNIGVNDILAKVEFEKHMDDDLQIGNALASLFDFITEINRQFEKLGKKDAEDILNFMKKVNTVLQVIDFDQEIPDEIRKLVSQRDEARKKKDFKASDMIRDKIRQMGYQVDDSAKGTIIKRL